MPRDGIKPSTEACGSEDPRLLGWCAVEAARDDTSGDTSISCFAFRFSFSNVLERPAGFPSKRCRLLLRGAAQGIPTYNSASRPKESTRGLALVALLGGPNWNAWFSFAPLSRSSVETRLWLSAVAAAAAAAAAPPTSSDESLFCSRVTGSELAPRGHLLDQTSRASDPAELALGMGRLVRGTGGFRAAAAVEPAVATAVEATLEAAVASRAAAAEAAAAVEPVDAKAGADATRMGDALWEREGIAG